MRYAYTGIAAISLILATSTAFATTDMGLSTVTIDGAEKSIMTIPINLRQSLTDNSKEASKQELKKIAGAATVVSRDEFDDSRAATPKDMLQYVPGVYVQTRYGQESRLSIRGSGLSRTYHSRGIKFLQDGIPMNFADGFSDYEEMDASAYSHMEVYKGANALKYGANTLGGAINFITPTGYTADRYRAGFDFGSYETKGGFASSGDVVGNADYFINVSNFDSDNYRHHTKENNSRLYTNIGYRFSPEVETRFYFSYADIDQELPGNLTKQQAELNPKQAAAVYLASDEQRNYYQYRVANKTTYKGDDFTTNVGLYTIQKDLYHPIFQVVDQQNNDFGAFADNTFYGKVMGLDNEFLMGTNLSTGRLDNKQFVNNGGVPGTMTSFNMQKSDNIDVYAENTLKATDRLSLITGTQIVYAQRELADYFLSDGNQSGEKLYKGMSPKIGLLYDYTKQLQFFTNYSWSYEPPSFSELTQSIPGFTGLADIEAQRAQTFEIGSRGELAKISWEAAWYYSSLQDELMTYSLGGTTTGVLNADKTIHTGIELGLSAVVANDVLNDGDDIQTRLAYTYGDFRFDGDSNWGNNQIPGAPAYFVVGELRYNHPSGFYIAPTFEATPEKYPVDMANTLYADPYAIIGLKAGYDVSKEATIFMDARNLLDKNYVATTGVITQQFTSPNNLAQFTPGDGRSIYFGVRLKMR